MVISLNKDNTNLSLNVNTLQIVDMLSKQTDYLSEIAKGLIRIYYNVQYNCLYVATPLSLGKYMNWNDDECKYIKEWVSSFLDYGPNNCLRTYVQWLNSNLGSYAILYGSRDIIGHTNKASHLIVDARLGFTASICIGVFNKDISIVGLQQKIATDLQTVLQNCKYIHIDHGRLSVIVN